MKKQISGQQRRELAEKLKISEPYLYQCLRGLRNMDPADAVRIELASGGLVSRFDLCQEHAKAIWPELVKSKRKAAHA